MRRAEKREFRRVIAARSALGKPISDAELDMVADYVAARLRLAELRDRVTPGLPTDEYLRLTRAIEAATSTSRRLARDLRLIAPPIPRPGKKEAARLAAEKLGTDAWDSLLEPDRPRSPFQVPRTPTGILGGK
ncbi:hypothetical protein ASF34_01185 [Methylobacterium sp. Leaf106]|nr:hypothetical protein ASF34_01185 [Methylobacterium sp. Leaf106]